MQQNWYVVYTKMNHEKKVASLLTKKKIINFCPLNCRKINYLRRNKILQEPLFKSYVFVYITPEEMAMVRQTDFVINFLYWMGNPAVINEDEIKAVKEFTSDYQEIVVERIEVNTYEAARAIADPSYTMEGNLFSLKNKTAKVTLPSLGYTIVAKIGEESIFGRETNILQNNSFVHSQ